MATPSCSKLSGNAGKRFRLLLACSFWALAVVIGSAAPAVLRVVTDNNYPPYAFLDADGNLQGELIDQWRLWEKKTGVRVEITGLNWGEALNRMKHGDFEVIDTVFENDERRQYLDFSPGYATIEVAAFFRKEISGITDVRSLRGFPVGVKDGDDAVGLLRAAGVETLVRFASYEAIVEAAKERKIAVMVIDRPPGLYFLHKAGLERQFRESQTLKAGQFHRAVHKGDAATLRLVEDGFALLSSQELRAIETKWSGVEPADSGSLRWLKLAGLGVLAAGIFVAVKIGLLRRAVRKQNAALAASEERFHSIFNAVSDAVFIHDLKNGRILDVNDRTCEMYRCTREQACRCAPSDMSEGTAPYNAETALRRFRRVAEGVTPQVFPWHCRRLDGTLFWGEVRMSRGRVGNEDVVVACVSDITERRRAERELEEATERFLLLSENIDQIFWIATADRRQLLYVSPACEKIWGCTSQTLSERPERWADCIEPDDRPRVLDRLLERQLKGTYAETYRIRRPDGQVRWIFDRAWPVKDPAGEIYRLVGIITDITERRLLETKMHHAQKMEAIGTLAGGIAHDFNNILGAIMGHAELAELEARDLGVQRNLNEILIACRRAAELVGQILAFSRQQDRKRVCVQLDQVVAEALRLLKAVLPSSLELSIQLSPTAPTVLADPTQVHQIVVNLCTNAVHALEGRAKPRLSVSLESYEADHAFVRHHPGAHEGRYAVVTVADNGCGMDRATLERIFEPFFTTKAPGKGSGLGLSVVHGVVQRHDGVLTVDSLPGEGTTFRVYFPENTQGPAAGETRATGPTKGAGQRILVVDDEEALIRLVGQILRKLGYVPESHSSPERALEVFRENPAGFDLVLTDLTMPGMSGLDLASFVRSLRSDIPVLMMTGLYADVTEKQLREAGITEVLLKPVDLTSLSLSLARALKRSTTH